jgi:hypothetical protein
VQLDSSKAGSYTGDVRIEDGGGQAFVFAVRGEIAELAAP